MESCILSGRWVGSFSEDRPLGWDPVAEGNRAGDGMARTVSEEKATDSYLLLTKGPAVGTAGHIHDAGFPACGVMDSGQET